MKERWNKDDFLVAIQKQGIDLAHKKKIVESVIELKVTNEELVSLDNLMIDININLDLRRYIAKNLYEKGFYSDIIFDTLLQFINETDLKFQVQVNSNIKSNRNIEIIDAIVRKLNKYYDKDNGVDWFFRNSGLSMFLDNGKVEDILFRMINHPTISSHNKKDLLVNNLNGRDYINLSTQKSINTLILFIKEREEYFYKFDWDSRYDWQVMGRLIPFIKKISDIDDYNILKKIIVNSKIIADNPDWDKEIIEGYFYRSWQDIIFLLAKSPNPDTFLEDKDIPKKAKKLFARVCSIEKLFNSYRTEYEDMLGYINYHIRYKQLPMYIRNDKRMYTIHNGIEICTEEINNNVLNCSPEIKKSLKKQFSEKRKNIKLTQKALIITEGKTDWRHLKKALERFQLMYDEYIDLNIEFEEYHDIGAGESTIDSWLKSTAKLKQEQRHIFMFDRDTSKYVEEYGKKEFIRVLDKDYLNRLKEKLEKHYGDKSSTKYLNIEQYLDNGLYQKADKEIQKAVIGNEYDEWKKLSNNQVYALCIPEIKNSDSPRTLDKICIEFYYKEKNLKTTKDGKRLFFADEFEFNKENNGDDSKRFISKCGQFKTSSCQVKKGAMAELTLIFTAVYSIDDAQCKNNLLLSKNDFTKYIENEVEGFDNFDIENFRLIFDVIERIVND